MSTQTRIDAYLRQYVEKWQIVGLSAAVVQEGAIVFSAAYGLQDQQTRQPATADTLFHIASVAKTLHPVVSHGQARSIPLCSAGYKRLRLFDNEKRVYILI